MINIPKDLIKFGLFRFLVSTEDHVAENEKLSEIVMIMCVVHGVVLGAHDRFSISPL